MGDGPLYRPRIIIANLRRVVVLLCHTYCRWRYSKQVIVILRMLLRSDTEGCAQKRRRTSSETQRIKRKIPLSCKHQPSNVVSFITIRSPRLIPGTPHFIKPVLDKQKQKQKTKACRGCCTVSASSGCLGAFPGLVAELLAAAHGTVHIVND